jgi:DNA-binding transcriptional MerR regulator
MDDIKELEIEPFVQLKTQDIAENLGIAESTVRKYCQVLEEKGYQFRRDETGTRIYTDHDQVALLELIKLRKEAKMALDVAADIVVTRRVRKISDVSPTQSVQPLKNQGFSMQNMEQLTHEIRYIKENLVSREQVNYLIQTVEKVLDTNTELLRKLNESEKQKEEIEKENRVLKQKLDVAVEILQRLDEKKEKKGFWQRLFR